MYTLQQLLRFQMSRSQPQLLKVRATANQPASAHSAPPTLKTRNLKLQSKTLKPKAPDGNLDVSNVQTCHVLGFRVYGVRKYGDPFLIPIIESWCAYWGASCMERVVQMLLELTATCTTPEPGKFTELTGG